MHCSPPLVIMMGPRLTEVDHCFGGELFSGRLLKRRESVPNPDSLGRFAIGRRRSHRAIRSPIRWAMPFRPAIGAGASSWVITSGHLARADGQTGRRADGAIWRDKRCTQRLTSSKSMSYLLLVVALSCPLLLAKKAAWERFVGTKEGRTPIRL